MVPSITRLSLVCCALLAVAPRADAVLRVFDPPAVDSWLYPFAGLAGLRPSSPTFGAFATAGAFDERDAQALFIFDTAPSIPAGRPPGAYLITSARLILDRSPTNAWVYDPSYDGYRTYLALENPGDPDQLPDTDAGRPMELYGVGYRLVGLDATTYDENATPFSSGPGQRVRYAYANDFAGLADRDVSNNVLDRFDPTPFAIGAIPGATPGSTVSGAGTVEFAINPFSPTAVAYLRSRLAQGSVDLLATSLAPASQGGPAVYPVYLNKESGTGAATLELDVRIAACGDGLDNDADTRIDYPADPQCSFHSDNKEQPSSCGLFGIEMAGVWLALRRRRSA